MSIPARQIVNVTPRVITAGGDNLVFNGLVISDSTYLPNDELLYFTSASDLANTLETTYGVSDGTNTPEYKYARRYFMGYQDSFIKPSTIMIVSRSKNDSAPSIVGGVVSSTEFDNFISILVDQEAQGASTATLTFTLDEGKSTEKTYTLSNFIGFTKGDRESAFVTAVNTKLASIEGNDITFAYNSTNATFTVTGTRFGADHTIKLSGETIATSLKLTAETGAVIRDGKNHKSLTQVLDDVDDLTQNWVTFSTCYELEQAEITEAAQWASTKEGENILYLYIAWASDDALTIAQALEAANVGATAIVKGYSSGATNNAYDLAAFVQGAAASIDWNRTNATITFAFKQQDGLSSQISTGTEASELVEAKCSFYGDYATRNDNFKWFYEGAMFGDYGFIDTYLNMIWLHDSLQVSLMTTLGSNGRVPYTPEGYAIIEAGLIGPVQKALRNGVIDKGVTLSETQKAQLTREYGSSSIVEMLQSNGYCLKVDESDATVRVNRDSPEVSLWYTYGGAVHRINVAATAVL